MDTITEKNTAAFIHLSTLTQCFIPFGNYIFPILIWTSKKDKSEFVDYNGKQALNFQLSILLYSILLILIAIPIFITTVLNSMSFNELLNNHEFFFNYISSENNITLITIGILAVLMFIILKITEFFLIIYATVKTSNGGIFKYPLTISFIK